jgi:hypothetical protein
MREGRMDFDDLIGALAARAAKVANERLQPDSRYAFRSALGPPMRDGMRVRLMMKLTGREAVLRMLLSTHGPKAFDRLALELVDEWRDEHASMIRSPDSEPEHDRAPHPPRRPLMEQNRQRVLEALRAAGFDPLALPYTPRGRICPAKQAASVAAGLPPHTFRRAWSELSKAGELRRAG